MPCGAAWRHRSVADLEAFESLGPFLPDLDAGHARRARAVVGPLDHSGDRGRGSSNAASTVPSGRLRTQPATS